MRRGTYLMVHLLRFHTVSSKGAGSIPSLWTEISHAGGCDRKKKKNEKKGTSIRGVWGVGSSVCGKNIQADETPLGQKALEREDDVLGAEKSANNIIQRGSWFITFAESVELQSLHLQRDENSSSGAFAHPSCNRHMGCGCRKERLAQARWGAKVRTWPPPNTTSSFKKDEPAKLPAHKGRRRQA